MLSEKQTKIKNIVDIKQTSFTTYQTLRQNRFSDVSIRNKLASMVYDYQANGLYERMHYMLDKVNHLL